MKRKSKRLKERRLFLLIKVNEDYLDYLSFNEKKQLFPIPLKRELQKALVSLHSTEARRRASVEMILTWAQFSWLNGCLPKWHKWHIGDDSNRCVIGPLFPSKILTSYSFLRELKQLPRALRGNKKAKAKSRRENQSWSFSIFSST